ncbi:MAG: sulfotransferase domain-containing protein [Chloroflexi bacterium]|nr:sulfotransferase domain-containing protein [Chloroflexota bacterium]
MSKPRRMSPVEAHVRRALKLLRWRWRRWRVARRYGVQALAAAPRLFGNAQTKAGSHLLHQVLLGFTAIGPFVDPGMPPVNRYEDNRKLPPAAIQKNLRRLRNGDIAYGYLPGREPYLSWLSSPGWATIHILRDPRDLAVSHVFYIADMQPYHDWHEYFNTVATSLEERLRIVIAGHRVGDLWFQDIRGRYKSYMGWLHQPGVLVVRFEDLRLRPRAALKTILDYVRARGSWPLAVSEDEALTRLQAAIQPHKSGTFRRGQPGNWREYFTPEIKDLFKRVAGDLLIELGYETDLDW